MDDDHTSPAVRLGCADRKLWEMKVKGAENAVLELDRALKCSAKAKATGRPTCVRRGNFASAKFGFSFSGGQQVSFGTPAGAPLPDAFCVEAIPYTPIGSTEEGMEKVCRKLIYIRHFGPCGW